MPSYDNYLLTTLQKVQYERYSLLSLSLLFLLMDKKYYNNYIFISFISFLSSLVIFSNFPDFVTWNASKPIYYEELYIDFEKLPEYPLTNNHKDTYFRIYTRSLILSSSLLTSILTCYWKFKTENSSFIEIAGITGGLLQLASILNVINGRIILYYIKQFISAQICDETMKKDFSVQTYFCDDVDDNDDVENNRGNNCVNFEYNSDYGELVEIPLSP